MGARMRKTLCLPPQQRIDTVWGQAKASKEPGLPGALAEAFMSLSLLLSISAGEEASGGPDGVFFPAGVIWAGLQPLLECSLLQAGTH